MAILRFFSSLRLTVVLLGLGILVIFFGTLAQTSEGLYIAQDRYFRSWFSTWSPHNLPWLKVPLPGGYLLGTLLLLNLVVAHYQRFKFTWKKSGIFLTHIGVILLLIGQLATDLFARESRMSFAEGDVRNYTEDFQKFELVVLTDATNSSLEQVVAFPEPFLKAGAVLTHELLPMTVQIKEWMPNSEPNFRAPMARNEPAQASQGVAKDFNFKSVPPTRKMDDKNIPTALIELTSPDGKSAGTWMLSGWSGDLNMAKAAGQSWARQMGAELGGRLLTRLTAQQAFESNGRRFRLVLRPVRYYEPFAIHLIKTTHEVYAGTDKPKNFQSRVRIDNPGAGEDREVDIYMNNPLRYRGLTFFQSQMGREELDANSRGTSVFQVVRNPSWLAPYVACLLVGAGLLVQFSIHLVGFIGKRKRA